MTVQQEPGVARPERIAKPNRNIQLVLLLPYYASHGVEVGRTHAPGLQRFGGRDAARDTSAQAAAVQQHRSRAAAPFAPAVEVRPKLVAAPSSGRSLAATESLAAIKKREHNVGCLVNRRDLSVTADGLLRDGGRGVPALLARDVQPVAHFALKRSAIAMT